MEKSRRSFFKKGLAGAILLTFDLQLVSFAE